MPVYEYRCGACGREFEQYLATAVAAVACPACASPDVTRKLSVVAIRSSGAAAGAAPRGSACCGGGCGCH